MMVLTSVSSSNLKTNMLIRFGTWSQNQRHTTNVLDRDSLSIFLSLRHLQKQHCLYVRTFSPYFQGLSPSYTFKLMKAPLSFLHTSIEPYTQMSPKDTDPRPRYLPPSQNSDYMKRGIYHIIPSLPSEKAGSEISDTDAEADGWDEAEYKRQTQVHFTELYKGQALMELRKMCKERNLRVRGNKSELAKRLARENVEIIFGWGHE